VEGLSGFYPIGGVDGRVGDFALGFGGGSCAFVAGLSGFYPIGGVDALVGDFVLGFGGGPEGLVGGFYSFTIGIFWGTNFFYSSTLSIV